jgi:hypothetical protein
MLMYDLFVVVMRTKQKSRKMKGNGIGCREDLPKEFWLTCRT